MAYNNRENACATKSDFARTVKDYAELAQIAAIVITIRVVILSPVTVLVNDDPSRMDYILGALGIVLWVTAFSIVNTAL